MSTFEAERIERSMKTILTLLMPELRQPQMDYKEMVRDAMERRDKEKALAAEQGGPQEAQTQGEEASSSTQAMSQEGDAENKQPEEKVKKEKKKKDKEKRKNEDERTRSNDRSPKRKKRREGKRSASRGGAKDRRANKHGKHRKRSASPTRKTRQRSDDRVEDQDEEIGCSASQAARSEASDVTTTPYGEHRIELSLPTVDKRALVQRRNSMEDIMETQRTGNKEETAKKLSVAIEDQADLSDNFRQNIEGWTAASSAHKVQTTPQQRYCSTGKCNAITTNNVKHRPSCAPSKSTTPRSSCASSPGNWEHQIQD